MKGFEKNIRAYTKSPNPHPPLPPQKLNGSPLSCVCGKPTKRGVATALCTFENLFRVSSTFAGSNGRTFMVTRNSTPLIKITSPLQNYFAGKILKAASTLVDATFRKKIHAPSSVPALLSKKCINVKEVLIFLMKLAF